MTAKECISHLYFKEFFEGVEIEDDDEEVPKFDWSFTEIFRQRSGGGGVWRLSKGFKVAL